MNVLKYYFDRLCCDDVPGFSPRMDRGGRGGARGGGRGGFRGGRGECWCFHIRPTRHSPPNGKLPVFHREVCTRRTRPPKPKQQLLGLLQCLSPQVEDSGPRRVEDFGAVVVAEAPRGGEGGEDSEQEEGGAAEGDSGQGGRS